ncbi:MAG: cell division protein FtsQ/DivIB [Burkholderiales bacterium]
MNVMWDNPRLLNLAANALFALAVVIFAGAGVQALLRSPLFPLREIVVEGALQHAAREEIEGAVEGVGGNFFAADLGAVRAKLEQVPWVRRVDVRRVWPDRLAVQIEEHVAFARWDESGLVNTFGEPFVAPIDKDSAARMPLFAGPAGTEQELTRRYRRFRELLAPLEDAPDQVVLTSRHAWQLHLASGLELELGRDGADGIEQRLARFVAAYPESIGKLGRKYEHVDLRYPNGFALRVAGWKS